MQSGKVLRAGTDLVAAIGAGDLISEHWPITTIAVATLPALASLVR